MTYVEHATPDAPEKSPFAFVSPQIEEILGFTPEEATSDPLFFERTLHPDDLPRIRAANIRAESTGEPFDEEFRQITKDGGIRWMHDRSVLVRDDDGAPRFWHGVTIDITARKEAERSLRLLEERYRTLVEQIPAVTFIETPGGPRRDLVHLPEPPGRADLRVHAEELLANPNHFGEFVHPEDRERVYAANTYSEETGEPFNEEFRIIRADGRVVWLDSRAVLVRDDEGNPRFWQGVAMDVTAHRELEPLPRPRGHGVRRARRRRRLALRSELAEALGQVRAERGGQGDAAIGTLVVLEDRDQRPADRRGRAVQRVQHLDLARRPPDPGLPTSRAVVGVVRARGELPVPALARQPHLEVVLLGRRASQIPGRHVHDAVGNIELADDLLLDAEDELELIPDSSGRANENISTLSNWWTRNIPPMSLP